MYGIARIDHDESHTHSWHVTVQRRHRIYTRHFSDRCHGGKAKALRAARAYRDDLLKRHAPLTRRDVCLITKKNNRSGVSGVTRIDVFERRNGRRYRRLYWDAQWPARSGRAIHKKFAISTYGERHAFLLATRARRQGLLTLKTAPYEPRVRAHGRR